MKLITFTDKTQVYYDPMHVKFYDSNKIQINFKIGHAISDDCSKLQNQVIQHDHKINRKFKDPRNIRILFGHACNFRCKYCQQNHTSYEHISKDKILKLEKLIEKLDLSILDTVQYWGGEPLLYWDEIKEFHNFFNKINPKIKTCIVTNGSLMNEEIFRFIIEHPRFALILSHDGPGQFLRGPDPLAKDSKTLKYFLALYKIKDIGLNDFNSYKQNFAVNPVLTKETKDLKTLVNYYENIFGGPVAIAESIPIIPTNTESAKFAFDDLPAYSEMLFNNLKEIDMTQFNNFKTQFDLFNIKLQISDFKVPLNKAICFTSDPRMLVFDIDGNLLPCQTFQANEILEDGCSANCGNLNDMDNIHMPVIHGVGSRLECQNCPVVSFCMSGCPFLIGKSHELDCKFKYAHFYGLFKFYLYVLMGKEIESINDTVV